MLIKNKQEDRILEETKMTKNSNSNGNTKATLNQFKNEVANELGISLKDGYNGDLTSKEAGSIGGEMVRRMIKRQEESMK